MIKVSFVLLSVLASFLMALPKLVIQAADEEFSVAIIQLVTHPSLDLIVEGIYEGLASKGYVEGENMTVDFQNAEGDINLLSTIAQQVVSKDPDLIVAVATPTAQAVQNVTSDIPIILGAITDPVSANLVDSLEAPGANITGVSDHVSYELQFELINEILPELKTIGMIYTTSEANADAEIQAAKEVAEEMGFEVVVEGINTTLDMNLVAQDLASQVDAIYVGSDNTIASAFESLLDATDKSQIPVFSTVDTFVEQGALSAVAINQKDIGVLTGEVAGEVLDGADTATYPIRFIEEPISFVNFETAERLGIVIPDSVKEAVTDILNK